jgi:hypothetical protein
MTVKGNLFRIRVRVWWLVAVLVAAAVPCISAQETVDKTVKTNVVAESTPSKKLSFININNNKKDDAYKIGEKISEEAEKRVRQLVKENKPFYDRMRENVKDWKISNIQSRWRRNEITEKVMIDAKVVIINSNDPLPQMIVTADNDVNCTGIPIFNIVCNFDTPISTNSGYYNSNPFNPIPGSIITFYANCTMDSANNAYISYWKDIQGTEPWNADGQAIPVTVNSTNPQGALVNMFSQSSCRPLKSGHNIPPAVSQSVLINGSASVSGSILLVLFLAVITLFSNS